MRRFLGHRAPDVSACPPGSRKSGVCLRLSSVVVLALLLAPAPAFAQKRPTTVTCTSEAGSRNLCPADTSQGVVLVRSFGGAACLLGKTWGYDDQGVWVADGCSAEFATGRTVTEIQEQAPIKQKSPEYVPNAGFLLYEGEKGQIYMRLMTYVRYLNQKD